MSDLINFLKKRIYSKKPEDNAYGQYNYGRVNANQGVKIMGLTTNPNSNDLDLFSLDYNTVEHVYARVHANSNTENDK